MDTTKWKSTLLPRDVYEELVVVPASKAARSADNCATSIEQWKMQNLSNRDQEYISEQVDTFKRQNDIPL